MQKLSSNDAAALKQKSFVPSDYVEWMEQNGWGDVNNSRYMLYSGLINLQEVHDVAPQGFWSFGDDMAGYSGCFSENGDGLVCEWDSATYEIDCTNIKFSEFMSRYER